MGEQVKTFDVVDFFDHFLLAFDVLLHFLNNGVCLFVELTLRLLLVLLFQFALTGDFIIKRISFIPEELEVTVITIFLLNCHLGFLALVA